MSGQRPRGLGWRLLRGLAAVLVTVAVISLLLHRLWLDRASLQGIAWWGHPWYLAAHLGLLAGLFLALVLGWRLIVNASGTPMRLPAAAAVWLIPNLGKYIPGKVLLFVGRVELAHRLGMRRAAAVTALTFEHMVLVLAALPFLGVALAQGSALGAQLSSAVLALLSLVALLLVAVPQQLQGVANRLLRRFGRQELATCPQRQDLLLLLLVHGSGWLLYGASGTMLAAALGLAPDRPVQVAVAFVAAWLLGFASMLTPGGLGVREAALVLLLTPVLASGEAIALALAARLSWTLVEVVGALLGLALSLGTRQR